MSETGDGWGNYVPPSITNGSTRMKTASDIDHPCKKSCAGWKEGYEKGVGVAFKRLGPDLDERLELIRIQLNMILDRLEK